MLGFNVFVIFLLVLFIFIVIAGVKIVPQGYNYTVERFGRYTRTLRPGLTLIIPRPCCTAALCCSVPYGLK